MDDTVIPRPHLAKSIANTSPEALPDDKSHVVIFMFPDALNFTAHWRYRVQQTAALPNLNVHVILPAAFTADLDIQFPANITFHFIPFRRGNLSLKHDPLTLLSLIWLFLRLRPEIVHAVTIKPVIYAGLVSRMLGIKARVFSITGLGYAFIATSALGQLAGRAARLGYWLALGGKNQRVLFENPDDCSVFVERSLIRQDVARVHIGGGLDMTHFSVDSDTPDPDPPKVVFAGRMLKDKGIYEFVEAVRHIKELGKNADFVLAGDIDALNPTTITHEEIKMWEKEGLVQWLGWQDDLIDTLRGASIVCLPSYREGAPRVLMEAMACRRACVATNVPGCRHVVQHGVTGILVPPKDAQSLAEALITLLDDPALRSEMGENGRKVAAHNFTDDSAAAFLHMVYRELAPLPKG